MKVLRSNTGFTLVEILIVIIVIGILVGLAISAIGGAQARARDAERKTDIGALQKSLEVFYLDNGYYPDGADFAIELFPGINSQSVIDPFGRTFTDSESEYTYNAAGCDSGQCTSYVVSAALEHADGNYTVSSPAQ